MNHNDKVIFEQLFYDARTPIKQIARFIGIKQPSVFSRIKKLEENGFIRQYDALPNIQCLPLIHKMYYCTLTKEQETRLLKLPQCTGMQLTFNSYTHQVFLFYRNEGEITDIEKLLPQKRLEQRITHSHRLGGTLFDVKQLSQKYTVPKPIHLDKTDIQLIIKLIHGNVKTSVIQLAKELNTNIAIIRYRKKRLFDNGFFLYCISQPGQAFTSMKIAYHVFDLTKDVTISSLTNIPRMIIAYQGTKSLTVIQLSLTFDEHLRYSRELFSQLEPITKSVETVIIDKPIRLNKFTEELFEK